MYNPADLKILASLELENWNIRRNHSKHYTSLKTAFSKINRSNSKSREM